MAATETTLRAARELDELYRAHAPVVYRYAFAVLGNQADAEDVTQTTFMNALRALERGEHPRKAENWLVTIAHNLIRQRWRQQQARPREVELDHELATLEAEDDGPAIEDLVRALQRIPETQREALVLRELEGRSYKEIASVLDVSVSALETLIFRARRSLAEELENLVTCDRAELALSQQTDGRLGRKERRRLAAHLSECPGCARIAALQMKRRGAFKGLALLPLPLSLTFFKGAPSASAAIGLPTIGGASAAAGGAAVGTGIAAKIAIGVTAVAVAGGAGYEGVKQVDRPATPARPAVVAQVTPAPHARTRVARAAQPGRSAVAHAPKLEREAKPVLAKRAQARRPKPTRAAEPSRGKSEQAPGRTRVLPARLPAFTPKQAEPKPATPRRNAVDKPTPAVRPIHAGGARGSAKGRGAAAPGHLRPAEVRPVKPKPKKEPRGVTDRSGSGA